MPANEVIVPLTRRPAPRDTLARPMRDLRISVMDRCNFRCPYCMPRETFHEQYRFLGSHERLSFDEIVRLARLFVPLGRAQAAPHRRRAAAAREPAGADRRSHRDPRRSRTWRSPPTACCWRSYASELKAAGLQRVTVSLDSLDEAVFARMSGGFGGVDRGARRHRARPRARNSCPIKVNAVIQRGVNDHTVLDLARALPRHAASSCASSSTWTSATAITGARTLVVPSRELAARIGARWPLTALKARLPRRGRRALRLRRRRRRGRLHLLGVAALLRRLLARAAVLGRRAVHLPVRHPGARPARRRCAAARATMRCWS